MPGRSGTVNGELLDSASLGMRWCWTVCWRAVKLALQVLLSDFEIEQSHVDIFVSQQLHEGRQADTQAEHFCGKCMPTMLHDA